MTGQFEFSERPVGPVSIVPQRIEALAEPQPPSTSMRSGKQIVYRYNGDPTTEEIDLDMDGDKSVPKQGSFVERNAGRWKVVRINVEMSAAEPFEVPIHRVFLTNKL